MTHHWCWLCMLSLQEWKTGRIPTVEEMWTIARMKDNHAEGLAGADRE
jgi:hypothetical protein